MRLIKTALPAIAVAGGLTAAILGLGASPAGAQPAPPPPAPGNGQPEDANSPAQSRVRL